MGLSVDHELLPRLGVSAGWYYTDYKNMRTYLTPTGTTASTYFTRNRLRSLADFDAFQIANPLPGYEGQRITVYNLKREKLSAVDNVDTNVPDTSGQKYHGFVFSANLRLPSGGNVFGGVTFERTSSVFCDSYDNPNQFRFCDTTGGNGEADALAQMSNAGPGSGVQGSLPFRGGMKIGGDYPLPYGVQLSSAIRIIAGTERIITYSVPVAAFTAAGLTRTQTVTVRLNNPGSLYYPNIKIVDLGLGKWFDLPNRLRAKVGLNVYNLFNPDTITSQTNGFGPTLGDPLDVILGRFWRGSLQVEW
jgi:hypothetical protein